MRILVVEDDKDVAGFVVRGLKETGHVVEHAENGRDGLFMAASENFDAIILDRMLPGGIDGLKILETLRAQKNVVPVMILSALADVDERVKGLKAGGDDYLTKPFAFRRAARPRRGSGSPRQDRSDADEAGRRRSGTGSAVPPGPPRRTEDRPAAAGVPVAGISDAPRRPGRHPHDAARGRVGLSLRSTNERDRRACLPAAAKGRQTVSDRR